MNSSCDDFEQSLPEFHTEIQVSTWSASLFMKVCLEYLKIHGYLSKCLFYFMHPFIDGHKYALHIFKGNTFRVFLDLCENGSQY